MSERSAELEMLAHLKVYILKKYRIRETPNLMTDADRSTNVFVSAGVKKGADSIFLFVAKNRVRDTGLGEGRKVICLPAPYLPMLSFLTVKMTSSRFPPW